MLGTNFKPLAAAGALQDPALPAGYAPFGIQAIGDRIFVACATQDAAGASLVANFGDGKINAFDPATGAMLGTLSGADGKPLVIDGLWGIAFGNGLFDQPLTTLFYAGGPAGETHGVYGRIDAQ